MADKGIHYIRCNFLCTTCAYAALAQIVVTKTKGEYIGYKRENYE
jgi:hypothetical protein